MVFGREVTLPLQAVIGQPMESDQSNYDDYLHDPKKKLKEIHGIARKNLKQAAVYQKLWKQRSVYLRKVNLYGHMSRQEK